MDLWSVIKTAAIVGGQLVIFTVIASYAWTTIHEFAHLIAAKITCGVDEWTMKVWPCKLNGEKVGGYVQYQPIKYQTKKGRALVSLAPFIISTLCCVILPIAVETRSLVFIAIMFAGVMDQLGGATVKSEIFWDLPHAAENLNIPLWRMRIYCLSVVVVSCIASFYAYINILKEIVIPG
ncbi:MAG: metalloprotease family protein [Promethearchaeota archaeon]|jgi:hypothetical protein